MCPRIELIYGKKFIWCLYGVTFANMNRIHQYEFIICSYHEMRVQQFLTTCVCIMLNFVLIVVFFACIFIVFVVCSVPFVVCEILCAVFCLTVVCYFVWYAICVIIIIIIIIIIMWECSGEGGWHWKRQVALICEVRSIGKSGERPLRRVRKYQNLLWD
jgi:hypothetical protein